MALKVDLPADTAPGFPPVILKGCYARVEDCHLHRDAEGARVADLTLVAYGTAPVSGKSLPPQALKYTYTIKDTVETTEGHWGVPDSTNEVTWVDAVSTPRPDYTVYFGEEVLKASGASAISRAYAYVKTLPLFAKAEDC